jgi:hypothetical protein
MTFLLYLILTVISAVILEFSLALIFDMPIIKIKKTVRDYRTSTEISRSDSSCPYIDIMSS